MTPAARLNWDHRPMLHKSVSPHGIPLLMAMLVGDPIGTAVSIAVTPDHRHDVVKFVVDAIQEKLERDRPMPDPGDR
jgi:hypothetical protein